MANHHILRGDVGTVHRGTFDAAIPPVLKINPATRSRSRPCRQRREPATAGIRLSSYRAAHDTCSTKVPRGIGAHLMTGPIAVAGAMPGDELVVEIVAIELALDWGWNMIKPGAGTLPEDFQKLRHISCADRPRAWRRDHAVGA